MPPSKFEADSTLRFRVRRASFFFCLFPLASSCSNHYFRAYAIIDFLANRLFFLNTVTYMSRPLCFTFRRYVVSGSTYLCVINFMMAPYRKMPTLDSLSLSLSSSSPPAKKK